MRYGYQNLRDHSLQLRTRRCGAIAFTSPIDDVGGADNAGASCAAASRSGRATADADAAITAYLTAACVAEERPDYGLGLRRTEPGASLDEGALTDRYFGQRQRNVQDEQVHPDEPEVAGSVCGSPDQLEPVELSHVERHVSARRARQQAESTRRPSGGSDWHDQGWFQLACVRSGRSKAQGRERQNDFNNLQLGIVAGFAA